MARSDWFHYYIIVCAIERIPVDCNHYLQLLNKFVKLKFLTFPVATSKQLVIATALARDHNSFQVITDLLNSDNLKEAVTQLCNDLQAYSFTMV